MTKNLSCLDSIYFLRLTGGIFTYVMALTSNFSMFWLPKVCKMHDLEATISYLTGFDILKLIFSLIVDFKPLKGKKIEKVHYKFRQPYCTRIRKLHSSFWKDFKAYESALNYLKIKTGFYTFWRFSRPKTKSSWHLFLSVRLCDVCYTLHRSYRKFEISVSAAFSFWHFQKYLRYGEVNRHIQ